MRTFMVAALLLLATAGYAGQKAITDTGEEVILNGDGTWVYANNAQKTVQKIETNKEKFNKPKDSTFLVKSTKNNSAFWINSAKWTFEKSQGDEVREYLFQLKGKDLYAMAITEGLEVPVESLVTIALENARGAAPDARVVMQEYRVVNGNKLIYMELSGTIQDIKFNYYGYYFSSPSGSTQLVAYTGSNVAAKYKSEINDFLNGLAVQ